MRTIAFDTLAFANKLKNAGVEPHIAEVQAEANAELLASLVDDTLATKQDLKEQESRIIMRIGAMMGGGIALLATLMSLLLHIAR